MIKSMTGYGNATGASGKLGLTVELRSVNNRFLDCNVRIPRVYTAAEDAIKAMVQSRISRGKVDVYVTIDASAADDVTIRINEPLAGAYVDAFQHLFDKYGVTNDLTASSLARFSDVLVVEKKETDTDQLTKDICAVLAQALDSFDSMRIAEGARLRDDILSRADEIERLTALAEAGKRYLSERGFSSMESTYAQYYGGCAVINYAAVQDGVLLYNDLIKLWIEIDTQAVVGFEASNYWFSHISRSLPAPEITAQQAQELLSPALTVQSVRMALIPLTLTDERLCYEFKCTYGEDAFVLYLNALTGDEEEVFQIIDSGDGQLVL